MVMIIFCSETNRNRASEKKMLILVCLSVYAVNGQFITANDGVEPASEILLEQCYGFIKF